MAEPTGTLTPGEFQRIRQLFEAALDRAPGERAAFVERACAGEPGVLAEVTRMLAADARTHAMVDQVGRTVGSPPPARAACPSCGVVMTTSHKFCPECGSPLAADGVEGRFRAGALFANRFRIVAALGRGGMGEVYRAHDLELGQPVALKFLSALRSDERARQRLRNEVRLARQLAHPNVCRVYDIGEAHGELYLSMEYVDGEDLAALLKRIGRVPVDKGIEIARKLCAGLAAAHAKGVLHRDFKPANIMIDAGGEVRIMDFGLAAVASELDQKDVGSGTPAYMAPEQLAGREATVQSDLYALGLVLYELFTGKAPFDARDPNDLQRQRESHPSTTPATLIPDIGPRVERAILRCLEPDPKLRPASALDVSSSLPGGDPLAEALAAGETPSPEMVAAAGSHETMAPKLAVAFLATALVSLAGILWLTPRLHMLTQVPLRPPAELQVRARDLARSLGYGSATADSEASIRYERTYPVYVGGRLTPNRRTVFQALATTPSPFSFTYEEGPAPFIRQVGGLGLRSAWAGAARANGLVSIDVDLEGRLRRFLGNPTRAVSAGSTPTPPDWDVLFRAAGLDSSRFITRAPSGQDVAADTTAAWSGSSSSTRPVPVIVEAASLRGQVTRFEVLFPWSTARGFSEPPLDMRFSDNLVSFIGFTFLVVLPIGAWFNWRRGRADVRSAMRLGISATALAFFIGVMLKTTDVPLAAVFVYAAAYLALEPWTRRLWPHAMVTWARVLAGRWRDPLVGRDLLVVVAFVTLNYLFQRVVGSFAGWYLDPGTEFVAGADFGLGLDTLLGGRIMAARMAASLLTATSVTFTFFAVLLAAKTVLKRPWTVVVVLFALWGPVGGASRIVEGDWASVVQWGLEIGFLFFLMMRYGLFAATVFSALSQLIDWSILTSNFGAWYGQSSLVATVVLVAVALYGFYAALGGRPVAVFTGDAATWAPERVRL